MAADPVTTTAPAPGAEYADTASAAYRDILQIIESVEPRIAAATRKELADQRDSLKLIASENYASPAVLLTMGTWLSDKYAEGTIGHRFYAGCQNVDTVETVAAEHARELFGSPHAYVQPHSGIDANLVAYWAILATRVEAPGPGRARGSRTSTTSPRPTGSSCGQAGKPAADGYVAGRGRAPHPRVPAEHQRQDVPPAQLRHRPDDRPAGLRRARRGRPRVQAAGAGRRVLGISAAGQLRQAARNRRRGGRHADGGHGPFRGPGRGQGVHRRRGPGAARPRHHDAPRTSRCAARAAGWCWPRRNTPTPSTRAARWCSAVRSRT